VEPDLLLDTQKMQAVFAAQQKKALLLRQSTVSERKARLLRLRELLTHHETEFQQAVYADFRKPAAEVSSTEILVTLLSIKHAIKHLRRWMAPRPVPMNLFMLGTRSRVVAEPKGVALIIAPWNYPIMLQLEPLVHAIAAGNTAILKPSELTPHTSGLMAKLLPQYFSEDEVALFEGGVEVATALLELPFNHIFFTGSPAVGKIVMRAAAQHLASVSLELGGKSPVIVDETANLRDAAEKIAWGKCLNAGQTCVAPDYLLVKAEKKAELIEEIKKVLQKFYNADSQGIAQSPHLARIINQRNHQRLVGLLQDAVAQGAQVVEGGQHEANQRYLAPTLLTDLRPEMKIMQEEIFGPLLPILTYQTLDEAIQLINAGEKPLALYVFSQHQPNIDKIIQQTSAGGTCINEIVLHFGHPDLPIGGTNNSGLGKSHGIYGFEAFSNLRPIMRQRIGHTAIKLFYPPYTEKVRKLIAQTRQFFG
jgi:aldehyde dehydrogenase (NAD+)